MKAIESFSFAVRSGRSSGHDWETLLNGSIWMMEAGVDFKTKAESFITVARENAKRRKLGLRVGRDGANVVIQAYNLQPSEIAAPAAPAAPASEVDECPVEEAEMDAPTPQEQQEQRDYIENAAMGFAPAAPAAPKTRRKRS